MAFVPASVAALRSASLLILALAVGCTDDGATGDTNADDTGGSTGTPSSESGDDADDGGTAGGETGQTAEVTWHEDIAPIVVGKCSGCHRDGGIAPFSFENYEATQPLAEAIAFAVQSGTMPPFGAEETDECEPPHAWKNDLRLSDEEKDLLQTWADTAAPEGDPTLAAEIPAPASTELEDADQALPMSTSVTLDGAQDQFLCFSLDPGLTEDAFLKALQVTPGNDKVVHHVLIYTDAEAESAELADENGYFECSGGAIGGDLIGAWAPGALPLRLPPDTGMHVPAGARLVMNVHYHPTGVSSEVDDATSIDVVWHDERPTFAARLALVGNAGGGDSLLPGPNDGNGTEFRIPAGASDHTEEMAFVLGDDIPAVQMFSVGTHMHYVGVDMKIEVERANGNRQCLLQTPNYKFEWQRSYEFDVPLADAPVIQAGDTLRLRCTYDNTMNNPGVAEALGQAGLDEPIDVFLGEETLDEMCLGVFGVVYPNIE